MQIYPNGFKHKKRSKAKLTAEERDIVIGRIKENINKKKCPSYFCDLADEIEQFAIFGSNWNKHLSSEEIKSIIDEIKNDMNPPDLNENI